MDELYTCSELYLRHRRGHKTIGLPQELHADYKHTDLILQYFLNPDYPQPSARKDTPKTT